jgi:hypothetical protein
MTPEVTMTSTPSIVFAVLAAASVALSGPTFAANGQPRVSYQLTGSAPVADYVSYQSDRGQNQQSHVSLPWTTQVDFTPGNPVLVIGAQGAGSITCTISIDGNVVSQATASGAPARTVCSH